MKHLEGWEAAMKTVDTYYAAATMTEANTALKRDTKFNVSVWLMKPNLARMDMGKPPATNAKEAPAPDKMIISNGKSIYEYDGPRKVRTSAALGPNGAGNNLLLELMSGPSAKALANRFTIITNKEDENFVILEVKPVFPNDKEEFDTLTIALCGAKFRERAYIPRMVVMKRDGGQTTETWDFEDPKVNPKGIDATTFTPVPIPVGWKDDQRVLPRSAAPSALPTGGIKAPPPTTPPGK
jgi:TIGR03009 family protein